MTDHIAAFMASDADLKHAGIKPGELKHYGVKGMKWGIRKDRQKASLEAPSGPETSAQRYTRLTAKAKRDGGNSLSDDELKFVTARGNAIAQVNRLNEQKPGFIADTAKQIVRSMAQQQIQKVAKKYI